MTARLPPVLTRRGLAALVALVLLVPACTRGDEHGNGGTVQATVAEDLLVEVMPRWEEIANITGSSQVNYPFTVDEHASAWRARWRCSGGRFEMRLTGEDEPLTTADCPAEGLQEGSGSGQMELAIDASEGWQIAIEQQVAEPVREPPSAEMTAPDAEELARSPVVGIERDGHGTALLYRLPDGRLAVRLEGLQVTPADPLEVWVSEVDDLADPAALSAAPSTVVGRLRSNVGDVNLLLPSDLVVEDVGSVIVWSPSDEAAYAGASLR